MQGAIPAQLRSILQSATALALPLRYPFRGLTTRHTLIFKINNSWAEFCPFDEYSPRAASRWLRCALEAANGLPSVAYPPVCINATVPAVPASQVPNILSLYPGTWCAKVKVSTQHAPLSHSSFHKTLEKDIERIKATYAHIISTQTKPPAIRIDANGTWSLSQARYALKKIADTGIPIQYAEQPVSSLTDMQQLKPIANALGIRIAADDIFRATSTSLRIPPTQMRKAADLLILKPQPMGGVNASLALARYYNMPVTVSSALETPIGLFASIRLLSKLKQHGIQTTQSTGIGTFSLMPNILKYGWEVRNGKIHTQIHTNISAPKPSQKALLLYRANENIEQYLRTRALRAFKFLH